MEYLSDWAEGEHPYGVPAECPHCSQKQDFTSFYYNGYGPPPSYVFTCGHCGACGPHSRGRERDDHFGARQDAVRQWNDRARGDIGAFQGAVGKWMLEVFGAEIAMDPLERIMRFLEEALELAQAEGMTAAEVGRVVDYVYGRPTGETAQEVGGVMVTLAAFCFRREIDLKAAALTEFDRIDAPDMRKKIFEKQAFKREQGLTSDGGFRS